MGCSNAWSNRGLSTEFQTVCTRIDSIFGRILSRETADARAAQKLGIDFYQNSGMSSRFPHVAHSDNQLIYSPRLPLLLDDSSKGQYCDPPCRFFAIHRLSTSNSRVGESARLVVQIKHQRDARHPWEMRARKAGTRRSFSGGTGGCFDI